MPCTLFLRTHEVWCLLSKNGLLCFVIDKIIVQLLNFGLTLNCICTAFYYTVVHIQKDAINHGNIIIDKFDPLF